MSNMVITDVCSQLSPLLQLIGQVLNIFKISLPLILIVIGIFDIGKAVVSSKSDDIKKNIKNFFKKVLVSLVVFFIPTIVMVVFGFVGKFTEAIEESGIDYEVCYSCIYKPGSEGCKRNVIEQED